MLSEINVDVGFLEVGVLGRLMVTLEGGRIGEMFRDCILEDFLDIDLLSHKILDLLVKYLSRLVFRWCLLIDLGARRTIFWLFLDFLRRFFGVALELRLPFLLIDCEVEGLEGLSLNDGE